MHARLATLTHSAILCGRQAINDKLLHPSEVEKRKTANEEIEPVRNHTREVVYTKKSRGSHLRPKNTGRWHFCAQREKGLDIVAFRSRRAYSMTRKQKTSDNHTDGCWMSCS